MSKKENSKSKSSKVSLVQEDSSRKWAAMLTQEEFATLQEKITEKPKFCSFFYLINSGIAVGQLATAVESSGVWGWDKYGRFAKFSVTEGKPSTPNGAGEALDALSSIEAEIRASKPTEVFMFTKYLDYPAHPIHFYGWPVDELPLFAIENNAADRRQPFVQELHIKRSTTLLIGLMLQFVKGNHKWAKHPNYKSQEELAQQLFKYAYDLEKAGKINSWGLRDSTVMKVFAEANKHLKTN